MSSPVEERLLRAISSLPARFHTKPSTRTEMDREIAEHNAKVEERKQAKKAAKLARRNRSIK